MATFQPVSVQRLYRMIANQIKTQIQSGVYNPGERLPSERELADILTVSRPSVREALIALEIEGYVDVRVGSGVFVTRPNENVRVPGAQHGEVTVFSNVADVGAHELLDARVLVEPVCAELAAKNATAAQIAAMETAMLALPSSGLPSQHNDTFHLTIAESCGNVALTSTVLHLWKLGENSAIFNKLNQHFVGDEVWQIAHLEHVSLFRAIQKRKPLAARRAMHLHLENIRRRLGLDSTSEGEI